MLTKDQFIDKLRDTNFECSIGLLDGENFLIIHDWDTIVKLEAFIAEYPGKTDKFIYLFNETIDGELAKLETIDISDNYRLTARWDGLMQLSAYKQWIFQHEIEEPNLGDFIEYGFDDEYTTCSECYNNIVRHSPDSYDWTPPLLTDEGYICDDCAPKYKDYILEEFCNVAKNIPNQFSTHELGLVKVNKDSYQQGMHRGMDDTPEPILEAFSKTDIDIWFKVHPSQFYYDFDVYVKKENLERAQALLDTIDTYQGYSTAGNLERALREAPVASTNIDGIQVTTIDLSTGTSTTKIISKE